MTLHKQTGAPVNIANVGAGNVFSNTAGTSTTVVTVKDGECDILTIEISNPNTSDCWLQLFNVASATAVTLGSTAPTNSYLIPAGADSTHRGAMDKIFVTPLLYPLGLKYQVTTTPTNGTNPGAACTLNMQVR